LAKTTLKAANAACDWISEKAWAATEFSPSGIPQLTYREARIRFGLPLQVAARSIGKVADAYKLDRHTMRTFRPLNAIGYDDRILSWHIDQRTVSITTLEGRLKIPFAAGGGQLALLATRQGESDLILPKGVFYLAATCNREQPEPAEVDDFLGVDFRVANIAADSDGKL
jgi:putative transposase